MRDDFSNETKETLARRVAYRCSNPQCQKITSGPQDNPSKAVNIGVAAHITAASPNGKRYDPNLTPKERKSINNGIWLCQNCGKLIDNDEKRFSVKLLQEWKTYTEEIIRTGIETQNNHLQNPSQIVKYFHTKITPFRISNHMISPQQLFVFFLLLFLIFFSPFLLSFFYKLPTWLTFPSLLLTLFFLLQTFAAYNFIEKRFAHVFAWNFECNDGKNISVTRINGNCPLCGSNIILQNAPKSSRLIGVCLRNKEIHTFSFDYTTFTGSYYPVEWHTKEQE